jgi:PleD family two-component response regulator
MRSITAGASIGSRGQVRRSGTTGVADRSLVVARILVVDDDADVRKVITYGLSPTHQVVTARNGAEAIAMIKGGDRFDVILSDVMMPELDGEGLYLELL